MGIRNSAKAIIINNGKILLNKNKNSLGEMCFSLPKGAIYYELPGGGRTSMRHLKKR